MNQMGPPSEQELDRLFRAKYGDTDLGPGPAMRRKFSYCTPDDYYEALVDRLVQPGCAWVDIGCGRHIFPSNPRLAKMLSLRCGFLLGADPDQTLEENPFVHERLRGTLEDCNYECRFDLATLRMVAEHVEDPQQLIGSLHRVVRPEGHVVVYTVHRFSPVPLLTSLVPFPLHHPVKRILWRTERKDTFPTRFRMNTRHKLSTLFSRNGFKEALFMRLDDCRTFQRFDVLAYCELSLRSLCHQIGISYPEHCLLGVYSKC